MKMFNLSRQRKKVRVLKFERLGAPASDDFSGRFGNEKAGKLCDVLKKSAPS
jgi:hypothetical protein